jgi:uncharacterized membrane protein YfcA
MNTPIDRAMGARLLLIGFLAGVLSGLLGVGGGIFIVPMLVLVAGFSQHSAHATSLAAVVPIALAGAIVFGGQAHVDLWIAAGLASGSLIGAPLGARWMAGMRESSLKIIFGVLLIILGIFIAIP